MDESDTPIPFEPKWFHLGIILAFLWAAFTVFLVWLIKVDTTLGVTFAVVGGTIGGIALTIFILYVY